MSNKEKYLAYAEEMSEADFVFIINMIEAYKAAERQRIKDEEKRAYAEDIAKAAKDPAFAARNEKCMKDFESIDRAEFAAEDEEW